MKKRYLLLFVPLALLIWASCSKTTPADTSGATGNTGSTGSTGSTGTTGSMLPNLTPPTDTIPLANTVSKTDTLKVIAYNVLNYGDGCQAATTVLDGYLKTIVQYEQPDLMSCEKMGSYPVTPGAYGNLADEMLSNAFNTTVAGKYAYATPTNVSYSTNMVTLFYNTQKLAFVKVQTLLNYLEDFNLYKLYYKDPNLAITHDTTFLYVVVNHTASGLATTDRDYQESTVMQKLRSKFLYLPNLINMGDFNLHGSVEPGYQSINSSADSLTQMSDPPFYPDKIYNYPGNWDNNPNAYAPYLTTSTRALSNVPNTCGTNGGAKSWYDHIFISPWLISGNNYVKYVRNSFQSIGNDGQRVGVDINATSPVVNTSVPASVLNALFQFSNKYPVSIKLVVKANRSGKSIPDPAEQN